LPIRGPTPFYKTLPHKENIAIIILKAIEDMDRIDYLKKNKNNSKKKSVTLKPYSPKPGCILNVWRAHFL
jgi:hypothetical protein